MIDDVDSVPSWPVVGIRLEHDGSVTVDGDPIPLGPGDDARTAAMERARHTAELLGRPVRVDACEPDGTVFPMVVDGTGEVAEAGAPIVPTTQRRGLLRRRTPKEPPPREVGSAREAAEDPVAAPPAPPPAPDVAREVPDPAPDFAAVPAAPRPTEEQTRVLARVRRIADAGDPRGACAELRDVARNADAGAGAALREVEAYLMFLAGDPLQASRLYLDTAADPAAAFSDSWALGVVECAHHCWLDVDDVGQAYELGREIVAAYVRLGAGSSLQGTHARTRQRELRGRLAIT